MIQAAILYHIKYRHAILQQPYTRTGPNGTILLAVNPYQWYHHLYTTTLQQQYAQALIYNNHDHHQRTHHNNTTPVVVLEPHVYETSSYAYRGLCMGEGDQSILVSGESGAGKTETVKLLLNDLATIQQAPSSSLDDDTPSNHDDPHSHHAAAASSSPIVQRILDSNPLLEAFGNAKTVRNDNSSRFGKYIQLQFHVEDPLTAAYRGKSIPSCVLIGSRCEVYLLEKSRVVHHDANSNERTYHIFYQLLATSDDYKATIWEGLVNTDNESYNYVGYTDTTSIEGVSDEERFHQTIQSLALIGIVDEKLRTLLRALCIVLQLGNLIFMDTDIDTNTMNNNTNSHDSATPSGSIPSPPPLYSSTDTTTHIGSKIDNVEDCIALAELMGVDTTILSAALTVRTVRARNEVFKVPLSMAVAKDSCDAFAKEIYAKIFLWLVRSINHATCAEQNYHPEPSSSSTTTAISGGNTAPKRRPQSQKPSLSSSVPEPQPYGIIGLLDIFGFESFKVNRFEQLCINYANEKLQQKFTQDIFRNVQSEYEYEGIALDEITYDDNRDVLDLVEGRMGLIAFLNEECVRPGGSDKGFVTKAAAMNKDNACFIRENSYTDRQFGIQHYAGRVVYDAVNFVTKNMDTLPTDLQDCATKSTNTIIANEFTNVNGMDETTVTTSTTTIAATAAGTAPRRRAPSATMTASSPSVNMVSPAKRAKGGSNLMGETVWSKFRSQLTTLMMNLKRTNTRYIRCIKPNTMKQPYIMQHVSTVEQLRCAGVVAAVTISRSAFPNRLEHDVVLDRFKSLWIKGEEVHYPMPNTLIDPKERSKDMVRQLLSPALKSLERTKDDGVTIVQAFVLGKTRTYFRAGALEFLEQERIRCLSKWAIIIQRIVRTYVIKSQYMRIRKSIITLQSGIRRNIVRQRYTKQRMNAISLQCFTRQVIAYQALIRLRRLFNATKIQSHWRMRRLASNYKHERRSAIAVQKIIRGSLQRPKYKSALIERREEAKLENQVIALQRKLEEAERRRMEAEKKAEEKAQVHVAVAAEFTKESNVPTAVEEKKEDEKHEVADEGSETSSLTNPDEPKTSHVLSSQQQALMDESGKMLEYLRKEVFKLRSHNAQLHSDFNLLKDNNQRLMDANASAGASFAALNQHAKKLSKVNEKLTADIQSYKQQVQKLSVTQVELKEELKMKQATYVAEVHSRLQYQKALSKIIDVAQDRCRDDRLVEDFLRIADSCEAEYMNGPTGMNSSRAGSSLFSPPRAGSKPNNSSTSDSSVLSSFRKMWS